MNSSAIWKRTLPLLLIILVIIGIAVSCTVFSKEKVVASIKDKDDLYFSITEGDRVYSITNGKMYDRLKSSVGISTLLERIDIDLLKKTTKGDSNYWDAVTDQEIDDAIEKAVFPEKDYPNGTDDLTEDEIEEKQADYRDTMFTSYGLKTEDEIRDYHRLAIAKKAYAKDELLKAIADADRKAAEDDDEEPYFTEDEIETYYNANYKNGYWALIVPFANEAEGEKMLKQLGIEQDEDNKDNWIHTETGEQLTATEVAQAFIDMYNSVYSREVEGYPENRISLKEDVHYTITDGKIEFNKVVSENEDDDSNRLYYTYKEIVDFQSEIQTFLNVQMNSFNPDATELPTTKSWYTPALKSYRGGKLYVYILKIGEVEAPKQEDVEDEIKDALIEAELTDNFIAKEIVQLRTLSGIKILDEALEASYISTVESYEEIYEKTKEESDTVIAKVGDKNYTADELFDMMDKRFGYAMVADEINYQRLLNNPEFNNIYDYYSKEAELSKKILDVETWESIRLKTVREKQNFASGAYSQYGYGPQYGWRNFIKDFYNVNDESELIYYFLYTEILNKFSKIEGDLSEVDKDSDLWKLYEKEMQEIADDYFSVTGIHLLISVNDADGNPIDPKEWNELQIEYAEELYRAIWDYYEAETGTSEEKFQAIANYFADAPLFLANREQTAGAQPQLDDLEYVLFESGSYDIQLSKYKTAGLSVKFENLGSFGQGQMVEEFEEAVRSIWEANPSSTSDTPYGYTPGSEDYEYLVTKFGYHLYINTSSTDIVKWNYEDDKDTKYVLPTLEMVKAYLEDSDSVTLTTADGKEVDFTPAMKTAVTTYFVPVRDELVGNYNTTIKLYEQIQDLTIDFKSGNYSNDDFNRFLNLRIESYQENLVYLAVEEQ